jgi:hypothetical protein
MTKPKQPSERDDARETELKGLGGLPSIVVNDRSEIPEKYTGFVGFLRNYSNFNQYCFYIYGRRTAFRVQCDHIIIETQVPRFAYRYLWFSTEKNLLEIFLRTVLPQ